MLTLNTNALLATCRVKPIGGTLALYVFNSSARPQVGQMCGGGFYAQSFNAAMADDAHSWPGDSEPSKAWAPPMKPGGMFSVKAAPSPAAGVGAQAGDLSYLDATLTEYVNGAGQADGTGAATGTAHEAALNGTPPPALNSLVDAMVPAGDSLTLNITPPDYVDYDHAIIGCRQALAWVYTSFVGVGVVPGNVTLAGLTPNVPTEVVALSLDSAGVSGYPSNILRATPTDGSGPLLERIEADVIRALQGITVAAGYYDTVEGAYRYGHQVDVEHAAMPVAFIHSQQADTEQGPLCGTSGISRRPLRIAVVMASRRPVGSVAEWPAQEAIRMEDAIVKAVLADRTRGGNALNTTPKESLFNPVTDKPLGDAVLVKMFEIEYWHQSDNPSVQTP